MKQDRARLLPAGGEVGHKALHGAVLHLVHLVCRGLVRPCLRDGVSVQPCQGPGVQGLLLACLGVEVRATQAQWPSRTLCEWARGQGFKVGAVLPLSCLFGTSVLEALKKISDHKSSFFES